MNDISLKKKLLLYTLGLILTSLIIGMISFFSLKEVIKNYEVVAKDNYPKMIQIQGIIQNSTEMRLELNHLVLMDFSSQIKDQSIEKIEELKNKNTLVIQSHSEISLNTDEQQRFNNLKRKYDIYVSNIEAITKIYKENKGADLYGNEKFKKLYLVELESAGKDLSLAGLDLIKVHEDLTKINVLKAHQQSEQSLALIIFCVLGIVLVSAFVGLKFSKNLDKNLKRMIDVLIFSSEEMSAVTKQIARSSETLSQSTNKQTSSLQETTASVEEMSAMIGISASNAKNASEQSNKSRDFAVKGREVVTDMIQSMSEINQSNSTILNQVVSSSQRMQEIVNIIQEIENKTKVINDIVFQTKLLSFNASVEAARAGEQGKGFAVVAEEVGNLAEMSGRASKDISEMLSASISKVQDIVSDNQSKISDMTSSGKGKIERGIKVAEECGAMLTNIVQTVSDVTSMADQIAEASRQQAKGISEVNQAMGQLDQITLSNSTTARETAKSAESLETQALHLTDQINVLKSIVNGDDSTKISNTIQNKINKKVVLDEKIKNHSVPQISKELVTPAVAVNVEKKVVPIRNEITLKNSKTNRESKKMEDSKVLPISKTANLSIPSAPPKHSSADGIPSYDHPGFEDV